MKKVLPIGIDNFSNIINDEFYYVDKTKAIEELLDSRGGVKLFPRPRRFGKTLFMSTLENFFDIDKKDVNKDLFKGLYINDTKYKDVQNTYPVISMSLKSLKQRTFKSVIEQYKIIDFMRSLLSNALKSNDYLKMGILTGVLKVSKESIFSDLNNLEVYSIIDDSYEEYFGFTESETKELLEYYDLSLTKKAKEMYNGYDFGGTPIYNP